MSSIILVFIKINFNSNLYIILQHIEETLFGIRKRSQKYIDLFDQKIAIVDNQFTQWLEGH